MAGPPSEDGRALARRLAAEVYLPLLLAQLGRGMLLPIVPLYLRAAGMSFTTTSVVLAALGMGGFLGGLPIGGLADRFGPERLFLGAVTTMAATAALLGISTAVFALIAFRLAYGAGSVGLRISVQMLVYAAAPIRRRGRSMSVLGGTVRLAFFVGPVIGGALVDLFGFGVAFATCGAVTLSGSAPFLAVHRGGEGRGLARPPARLDGVLDALRRDRFLLLAAGIGAALVMTVREGRHVLVPLLGDELELSATTVGALVAVGTGADLVLFPAAGWLMDRFGRLHAIVPAFTLLGLGMLVIGRWPTTTGIIVAGVVMGVGNGMSAGTMLTLGSDLAPEESPGPFMAALGVMQDAGVVLGPIVVGWLADATSLADSALVLAVVMALAIAWIVVVLGDTANPTRPWIVARLESNRRPTARSLGT